MNNINHVRLQRLSAKGWEVFPTDRELHNRAANELGPTQLIHRETGIGPVPIDRAEQIEAQRERQALAASGPEDE